MVIKALLTFAFLNFYVDDHSFFSTGAQLDRIASVNLDSFGVPPRENNGIAKNILCAVAEFDVNTDASPAIRFDHRFTGVSLGVHVRNLYASACDIANEDSVLRFGVVPVPWSEQRDFRVNGGGLTIVFDRDAVMYRDAFIVSSSGSR